MSDLDRYFRGQVPQAPAQTEIAAEGTVLGVFPDDQKVTVLLKRTGSVFGPMSYTTSPTPPEVGDQCLVIFVGAGIDTAWCVGWAPVN